MNNNENRLNRVIISAYKPPSVDNNVFTTELSKALDEVFLLSENFVCIYRRPEFRFIAALIQ